MSERERDPVEVELTDLLDRRAASIEAEPVPVSEIVRRSRQRGRRWQVGGVVGAVVVVLLVLAVVASGDRTTTVSADGPPPGSSPPGTSVGTTAAPRPQTSASTSTSVPGAPPSSEGPAPTTVVSAPPPGKLVPDPAATGLLASPLRITVDPAAGLHDGEQVTVTGSGFPAGASVGLVMCSSDALVATSLAQAQSWCDIGSAVGFVGQSGITVAADGTFQTRYQLRGQLATVGRIYDCTVATVDPAESYALRAQGLLGPASFPPGVWGCAVAAVVTKLVPTGGTSSTLDYVAATALMVDFRR